MKFKEVNAGWIKQIPVHWDMKKVKDVYKFVSVKVNDNEYPALTVSSKYGITPQMEHVAKTQNGDSRKRVEKGDFVINSRADRPGACGISKFDGSVSLICHVLKPRNEKLINNKYMHYLFRNSLFSQEFFRWGRGIVSDLWTTRKDEFSNLQIPLPSLNEQKIIGEYLERKENSINLSIGLLDKQIERLSEQRRAVITETVERGLNPNVKIRHSGVECIGEIPDHWSVKRLKYVLELNPSKNEVKHYKDIDVTFLPMENILAPNEVDYASIKTIEEVYSSYTYFKNNDLVIAKVTPCFENGNIAVMQGLVNNIGFGTTELHVLRAKTSQNINFYYYLTQSTRFMQEGVSTMYGVGGLKRVPADFILNYKFAMPPIDEQNEIVTYLNKKTGDISKSIKVIQQQINKLKEYRQSLIYEAVTGKIHVQEMEPVEAR